MNVAGTVTNCKVCNRPVPAVGHQDNARICTCSPHCAAVLYRTENPGAFSSREAGTTRRHG